MHTAPHIVHGVIQCGFNSGKLCGQLLLFFPHNLHGPYLEEGTSEKMTYIVMDLPGDPVSLGEGCQLDLILLFFHKFPVLLLQIKGFLTGAVLGVVKFRHHIFIFYRPPGDVDCKHPCHEVQKKGRYGEIVKMVQVCRDPGKLQNPFPGALTVIVNNRKKDCQTGVEQGDSDTDPTQMIPGPFPVQKGNERGYTE